MFYPRLENAGNILASFWIQVSGKIYNLLVLNRNKAYSEPRKELYYAVNDKFNL